MRSKYGFVTTESRSFLMSKIKASETTPEQILRSKIWSLGYRYRKNVKSLPGKPDLVFTRARLVVFVDGEFWHGYQWQSKKKRIKANKKYWIMKIERNMERDKKQMRELRKLGWKVVRFWEHQVRHDLDNCIQRILMNLSTH